jgi:hypothetical protein
MAGPVTVTDVGPETVNALLPPSAGSASLIAASARPDCCMDLWIATVGLAQTVPALNAANKAHRYCVCMPGPYRIFIRR